MTDTSDQMPQGGYILPNFPLGYWRDNPNATRFLGLLDYVIDREWSNVKKLDGKYDVDKSLGHGLDDIGAIVNLPRFDLAESDDAYRARIEAATAFSEGASNNQKMAAYLSAQFGTPVEVEDGLAGTAAFTVTLLRSSPYVSHVAGMVKIIKAAGTVFTVLVVVGSGLPSRLRDVRLGDTFVGRPRGGVTFGGS